MPLPSSDPLVATAAAIDARFAQVLMEALPEPDKMSPADRTARINLYKEMLKVMDVPEEHLRFGVRLITVDRASAAKEARSNASAAKKASKSDVVPSIEDL